MLGVERVGVDDSFFDLGGDSILSMQVVARARAAGLLCRPRDVFVEQTVARLAQVAVFADGDAGVVDEGLGPVVATPIMGWLHGVDGPVDQFNQTVVLRAPVGVAEADVKVVVQALLDRHAMLRLRVEDDGAGGWSLTVPEAGSVLAHGCLQSVDVLSDEALVAARSRLDPAAGVMVSALWVPAMSQLALIVHHLAVDGVSWRILLEDLNIAWAQHHGGQPVALPTGGTSFARWATLLDGHSRTAGVTAVAETWRQVAAVPPALPAVQPAVDTYATAGQVSVSLDVETTRQLLGEVPAAFHAGVQDILLIAFGLAFAEFLGTGRADRHRRRGSRPRRGDRRRRRSVAHGGLVHHQVSGVAGGGRVVLGAGACRWGGVGPDHQGRQGAVAGPARRFDLRFVALSESRGGSGRVRSERSASTIWAASAPAPASSPRTCGASTRTQCRSLQRRRPRPPRWRTPWNSTPAPWTPTRVRTYTRRGPGRPRPLTRTRSARLSRLWFEALAGICANVRSGGGGLTPADIVPARLSQQQIDELAQQYEIADVLPLTPLQQGLLFHTETAQGTEELYSVQLDITVAGVLDRWRLRDAVQTVVARHPNLAARFCEQFGEPVQVIPADPEIAWQYVELNDDADVDERIEQIAAAERAAVCDLAHQPQFRAALIRTAQDQYHFLLTNHHIVLDGWSKPILLQEIFASYFGGRLPEPVPYRRFITWLASQDNDGAKAAWRRVFNGFETPTLVGPPGRLALGRRSVELFQVSAEITQSLGELARSCHTTVSTVLQAAWAQILMWLTGQHDVAFGTAVSGRPADVVNAGSMVGLLINMVPVRAGITAATTVADLLSQLQCVYNDTLEHQHLALNEIHQATSHDRLFDTIFVYENYPLDTAALSGMQMLAITGFTNREYNHYPLSVQAVPGNELGLRVEFDTDVFDAASIDTLIGRFRRVLAAMAADPDRRLSSLDVLDAGEHARLDEIGNRAVLIAPVSAPVSIPAAVCCTGGPLARGGRGDLRGPLVDLRRGG